MVYYGTELNDVINFVIGAHHEHEFDFGKYDQFFAHPLSYDEFVKKAEEIAYKRAAYLPEWDQSAKIKWYMERYNKMYQTTAKLDRKGMLRKWIGWARSIRFNNEGAHAAFTFGSIGTIPTGPVQGWGVPLTYTTV